MRIRTAHDRAFVLEQLDVVDFRSSPEFFYLFTPNVDHAPDMLRIHLRQCQIMTWAKTNYAANACLALCPEQRVRANVTNRTPFLECGIIILKDVLTCVVWIACPASPRITRA